MFVVLCNKTVVDEFHSAHDFKQVIAMSHRRQILLLRSTQIVLAVAFYLCFFHVATWLAAEPRTNLDKRWEGKLPAHWKNVVVGGGKVTQWRRGTVAEEPVRFALSCLVFGAVSFGMLYTEIAINRKKRKEVVRQMAHNSPPLWEPKDP